MRGVAGLVLGPDAGAGRDAPSGRLYFRRGFNPQPHVAVFTRDHRSQALMNSAGPGISAYAASDAGSGPLSTRLGRPERLPDAVPQRRQLPLLVAVRVEDVAEQLSGRPVV